MSFLSIKRSDIFRNSLLSLITGLFQLFHTDGTFMLGCPRSSRQRLYEVLLCFFFTDSLISQTMKRSRPSEVYRRFVPIGWTS